MVNQLLLDDLIACHYDVGLVRKLFYEWYFYGALLGDLVQFELLVEGGTEDVQGLVLVFLGVARNVEEHELAEAAVGFYEVIVLPVELLLDDPVTVEGVVLEPLLGAIAACRGAHKENLDLLFEELLLLAKGHFTERRNIHLDEKDAPVHDYLLFFYLFVHYVTGVEEVNAALSKLD